MRRACALAACLLAGCAAFPAPSPPAPGDGLVERRIDKAGHRYVVAGDSVRIDGIGHLPLLRETDEALYVAVASAPTEAPATRPAATVVPAPYAAPFDARHRLLPSERDAPRDGQWRDRFDLHDLDGDGRVELVAAPPRKHLTPPRVYDLAKADGALAFARRDVAFPARRWDYGAAAAGDFDGDGRVDLAFGMHLTAITVVFARDGGFAERSAGLPGAPDGARGSAVALATRRAGSRDTLLALAELASPPADAAARARPRFRGLVEFVFTGERWEVRDTLDAGLTGRALVQARDARCGEKLVAASTTGEGALAWQHDGAAWRARALPREPAERTHAAAVALGDFDGDGCNDIAVAGAHYASGRWHSTLTVHLDRGDAFESRLLERAPGRDPATALAAAPSPCCGTVLVAGTREGSLRAYDARTGRVARIAEAAAPAALRGCSVRHIAAQGDTLIVAWAGEPTLDRPGCLEGGGLGAFAWQ